MLTLVAGKHVRFDNTQFAFVDELNQSHFCDGKRKLLEHDEIPKRSLTLV